MEKKRTLSNVESGKKIGDGTGSGKFVHEIDAISKCLYSDKSFSLSSISRINSRSKTSGKSTLLPEFKSKTCVGKDRQRKDKRSIWDWKPFRALSNTRTRTFNCCFSLHVHSIEGLPPEFDDSSLCVYWKRKDGVLVTKPSKVQEGTAEFEETLTYSCPVYGSRNGPHRSLKYEAKLFLIHALVIEVPELDLGNHRVDLTRVLPLTLEELEEEKSNGKWTTSFKLSGKAMGAIMNVSFGYMVMGDSSHPAANNHNAPNSLSLKKYSSFKTEAKVSEADERSRVQHVEYGLQSQRSSISVGSLEEVKELHEVLPMSRSELASSIDILYKNFDESKLSVPKDHDPEAGLSKENCEPPNHTEGCESNKFSVTDQGIEWSSTEPFESDKHIIEGDDVTLSVREETIEVDTSTQLTSQSSSSKEVPTVQDCNEYESVSTKESLMKELDSALHTVPQLEYMALESPNEEHQMDFVSEHAINQMQKSTSLEDVTETVVSEFLSMLEIEQSPFSLSSESEPESPREHLLRQFEKEALAEGFSLFDLNMSKQHDEQVSHYTPPKFYLGNFPADFRPLCRPHDGDLIDPQAARSKIKAKMLENLETEALMREWGVSEKAFQHSSPTFPTDYRSPVDFHPDEPIELPPLGEGLGPFLQTKDGGFLRSMNPSHFRQAKAGGKLVMQVSRPVVLPAEMGAGVMEVLQSLASVGIEKLSVQANKLMPLEDITGKTMQQVAWDAMPAFPEPQRQSSVQHDAATRKVKKNVQKGIKGRTSGFGSDRVSSCSVSNEMGSEYVSLEDLAPLAMDKIEVLSVEGLRIQSGMSGDEAPSKIYAHSFSNSSATLGKGTCIGGSNGFGGPVGLQLLDVKESGNDVDGIIGLSLTLDEWMKLDGGDIDDIDNMSDRTSKILAAHHANSFESIRGRSTGEKRKGKVNGRPCGLLGNNFTVALMMHLRDPMRNYEPVGTPMLALVQVERVFLPPKPRIYCTVSDMPNIVVEDDESENLAKVDIKDKAKSKETSGEEDIAMFTINDVHVAGLKVESSKKKLWGTSTQQQSGSRWLLANGMCKGKGNKHPLMKSNTLSKSSASATAEVQPDDSLWSVTSRNRGAGVKWKKLEDLNPLVRNPNVVFPSEKGMLG